MMITQTCILCTGKTRQVYRPKKSTVGLRILICKKCGFVQSTKHKRKNIATRKEFFLSSDSNYSPVRVGKKQMLQQAIQLIEEFEINPLEVLDLAAGRGDFVNFISEKFPKANVTALEVDDYMVRDLKIQNKCRLIMGDYREVDLSGSFHLIYSCHTLEHFIDPMNYLIFCYQHLNDGGYLLVDVPNLLGSVEALVLDDFFYDNHRVYFEEDTLDDLFARLNFSLCKKMIRVDRCIYLLQKTNNFNYNNTGKSKEAIYLRNYQIIKKYKALLKNNRKAVKKIVKKAINKNINKKIIVVGAGRMLHAFIRYGKLNCDKIELLIDNYLSVVSNKMYGKELISFVDLELNQELDKYVFLILSRTSNAELIDLVKSRFPTVEVITAFQLFENFKDSKKNSELDESWVK